MSSIATLEENWKTYVIKHPDGLRILEHWGTSQTCTCTYVLCQDSVTNAR